jgi:cytochrome c-type biogenesis protein CcmF
MGKISVGPPYFDTVFVPLMVPLLLLMGIGPLTRWREADLKSVLRALRAAALGALTGALAIAAMVDGWHAMTVLGLFLALWIVGSVLTDLWPWLRGPGLRQLPRAIAGMMVAHLGVAAFVFGVTMVRSTQVEQDVRMSPGDSVELAGYRFTLRGVVDVRGPNYDALQGLVEVTRHGKPVAALRPEKRMYRVQSNPMTEAAIDPGLTRDLYVSLGESADGIAWTVRLYVKPFVDWIWGGCLLMALGGALAASDRRYRRSASASAATDAGPGASAWQARSA